MKEKSHEDNPPVDGREVKMAAGMVCSRSGRVNKDLYNSALSTLERFSSEIGAEKTVEFFGLLRKDLDSKFSGAENIELNGKNEGFNFYSFEWKPDVQAGLLSKINPFGPIVGVLRTLARSAHSDHVPGKIVEIPVNGGSFDEAAIKLKKTCGDIGKRVIKMYQTGSSIWSLFFSYAYPQLSFDSSGNMYVKAENGRSLSSEVQRLDLLRKVIGDNAVRILAVFTKKSILHRKRVVGYAMEKIEEIEDIYNASFLNRVLGKSICEQVSSMYIKMFLNSYVHGDVAVDAYPSINAHNMLIGKDGKVKLIDSYGLDYMKKAHRNYSPELSMAIEHVYVLPLLARLLEAIALSLDMSVKKEQ